MLCIFYSLLWETLTGREHLLFYGRLKNLAVEDSLRSLNLFNGGVADKQAGKYSGGMKRRLSVAISLIGDPKVVYMDEPSTGLDPASRSCLWNVLKRAKQDKVYMPVLIISLTVLLALPAHSMEEAEALCDRLGIFDVRIADVFRAVEIAKTEFPVFAWGISDTTLEDVFIKVATAA
ncbi:ABC transporter A family member 6 [Linum perenne]